MISKVLLLVLVFLLTGLHTLLKGPPLARSPFSALPDAPLRLFIVRSVRLRFLSLCCLLIIFALRAFAAVRALGSQKGAAACALLLKVPRTHSERQIARELETQMREKGEQCQVLSVSKVYCIDDCIKALRQLALGRKALRQAQLGGAAAPRLEKLRDAALQAKDAVNKTLESFQGEKGESERFSGRAFAVFASSAQRSAAERAFSRLHRNRSTEYRVKEAFEPQAYDWLHFHAGRRRDWFAFARVMGSVALVICCTTLSLLALSQLRHAVKRAVPAALLRYAFLTAAALTIAASNSLLARVIKVAMRQWRGPLFDTDAARRFLCTALCIWLNTTLSISALSLIVYRRRNYACVWKDRGVATLITATLVAEFVASAAALLDPRYLKRWRQFRRVRRLVRDNHLDNTLLQAELNEAAEKVPYDLVGEHARLFALTGLAVFFQLVAPYAPLLVAAATVLRLGVQGWILCHRALRLQELGKRFSDATLLAFDCCLLLYGVGFLLFEWAVGAPVVGGVLTASGALGLTILGRVAAWLQPRDTKSMDASYAPAYIEANPLSPVFTDEGRGGRGMFATQRKQMLRRALTAYVLQRYRWGHGSKNIYPIDLNEALSPEDLPVADEGVLRLFVAPRGEEQAHRRRSSHDLAVLVPPNGRRSRSVQPNHL